MHLIKVDAIKKDEFPSLAEKHDSIVQQLRREKAEPNYRDKVRELDERAFESPDSLERLVDLTGTPAKHVAGVTRQQGSAPFDNASLRDAAFSDDVLSRSLNSRVIEVGDDAYVLRMTAHHEPTQRPLQQVAAEIRARLTTEAATAKARQAAKDIVAKVDAGEGTATSAATYGLTWKVIAGATRSHTGDDAAITAAAFDLPRPTADQRSVTSTALHNGAIAVITVTAVADGDYAALSKSDVDAIRAQLSRRSGNEDFQSLFQSLRDSATIEQG
jgi:peptidyl-prolyl cis-trans isomerase D